MSDPVQPDPSTTPPAAKAGVASAASIATKQRRSDAGDKTTATSLTAAGCGAFLLWIFGMIDAGKFFVPPVETAMFMGAGILPLVQAFGRKWIREIEQPAIVLGGVNGHAPVQTQSNQLSPGLRGSPGA